MYSLIEFRTKRNTDRKPYTQREEGKESIIFTKSFEKKLHVFTVQ